MLEGAKVIAAPPAAGKPSPSAVKDVDEKDNEFKIDGPRVRRQPDGVTWRAACVMARTAADGGDVQHVTLWVMRGAPLVRDGEGRRLCSAL